MNLLEEKREKILKNLRLREEFLNMSPKAQCIKEKIINWTLSKFKTFSLEKVFLR